MKETKQLTKKLVIAIVTEKRPCSQDSGRKYINEYTSQDEDTPFISAIVDCIRDRSFTEALEILEEYGVTGSLARFLVAYLQVSEGWDVWC